MMKSFKKAVAGLVALAFAAAAMPVISTSAEAGHRHYRSYGYYDGGYYAPRHKYYRRHYRRDHRRAVVAGIAGFAFGAMIGHSLAQPRYYNRPYHRHYYNSGYRPQPWTSEWYAYCASKYRSFHARSGTFQPYHGPRKLCR